MEKRIKRKRKESNRVAKDTKYEHQDIETYGGCSEIDNIFLAV